MGLLNQTAAIESVIRGFLTVAIILSALISQGCIVSTAVEIAAETIEAGVEVTGAVIGTAVDVVVPDGDDDKEQD